MSILNRVRLASGLILMTYVATHLLNHALGIISLNAMEEGRHVFLFVWRSPPGTVLILGAITAHIVCILITLFRRRTWRGIRPGEIVQLATGFAIPPLLILHVVANRGLHEMFGFEDTYAWMLMNVWVWAPWEGVKQAIVTVIAWTHGCMGIHFWLRLKPWYRQYYQVLYTVGLMILIGGLAGFVAGGQKVEQLDRLDIDWKDNFQTHMLMLPGTTQDTVLGIVNTAYTIMISVVLSLIVLRLGIVLWERRRGLVTIWYPNDQKSTIEQGMTVLEASRRANIPHASVCGGRGRCSTCRVRVLEGLENLDPPSDLEAKVLRRVGAPDEVRLACQLRPQEGCSVLPLLPANATARDGFQKPGYLQGAEREIAILFADLRSFTKFSEQKLPYDVVFVINQYFRHMGSAVEQAGGSLDKFIGDGVMALFGIETGPEDGARKALQAARLMAQALEEMNTNLQNDLPNPFRLGIGIHIGEAIVGEMGYRQAVSITAIGDAVNTASRLESANKDFGSQLIFSNRLARVGGIDVSGLRHEEIMVRGREEAMEILVLDDARDLTEDAIHAGQKTEPA